MPAKSLINKSSLSKRTAKAPAKQRLVKAAVRPAAKRGVGRAKKQLSAPHAEKQAKQPSKQSQLIALLRSSTGGTIAAMTALTGWQPHTVRGAISGVLRKKLKLNVACVAEGNGDRVYRIVESTS